eukprot:1640798-Amphidinium_carterae.1
MDTDGCSVYSVASDESQEVFLSESYREDGAHEFVHSAVRDGVASVREVFVSQIRNAVPMRLSPTLRSLCHKTPVHLIVLLALSGLESYQVQDPKAPLRKPELGSPRGTPPKVDPFWAYPNC